MKDVEMHSQDLMNGDWMDQQPPRSLPQRDSHLEHKYPGATHERPNHMNSIYTVFPQEYPDITPKQPQERKGQATGKVGIECLDQISKDSREVSWRISSIC
jgi:hypothetical protein